MATKTFEELKQLAIQIRDEKTNKQNTATRIGTQMLEHLNKLEQDYYDKTATDEELKQRDEKLTELSSQFGKSITEQGKSDVATWAFTGAFDRLTELVYIRVVTDADITVAMLNKDYSTSTDIRLTKEWQLVDARNMTGTRVYFQLSKDADATLQMIQQSLVCVYAQRQYDVIVDQSGKGDYDNLYDAIVNVDDTIRHITIYVRNGTYIMPRQTVRDYTKRAYRNISIIGEDKNNVIIRNDTGIYNNAEDNYVDDAPLKLSGNVTLKNLTVVCTHKDTPSDTDLNIGAYCLHLDNDCNKGSVFEIDNCDFHNEQFACIGMGLRDGLTVRIRNSRFYSDVLETFKHDGWAGAIIVHDGWAGGEQKLELFNNYIVATSDVAVALSTSYNNPYEALLIGNAIFSALSDNPERTLLLSSPNTFAKNSCLNNIDIAP